MKKELTKSILSVYGSHDKNVEYSSSIQKIRELLAMNNNPNYNSIVLLGYDHLLAPPVGENYLVRDDFVNEIVKWILSINQ